MDHSDTGTGAAVKLNLGCGDRYVEGWHNVDHAGSPHRKDEVVDLRGGLPPHWADCDITHIYIGHLLEHLFREEARDLLYALKALTEDRIETEIMVVGPDVSIAKTMAKAGTLEVALEPIIKGGHRWLGDEHKWACTGPSVAKLMEDSCWANVQLLASISDVPQEWPVADRGPQWQFAVWGKAPRQ